MAKKVCETCVNARFYFHGGSYWEPPEYGMYCVKENEFTEDWHEDYGITLDCPLFVEGIHSWEQLERQLDGNAKKAVYNGTDCGAWIRDCDSMGAEVGSIVEGVDLETDTYYLPYPFTMEQLWEALGCVDDEAENIWNITHGCEHCLGGEPNEYGYYSIDPDCPVCKGEGVVL